MEARSGRLWIFSPNSRLANSKADVICGDPGANPNRLIAAQASRKPRLGKVKQLRARLFLVLYEAGDILLPSDETPKLLGS